MITRKEYKNNVIKTLSDYKDLFNELDEDTVYNIYLAFENNRFREVFSLLHILFFALDKKHGEERKALLKLDLTEFEERNISREDTLLVTEMEVEKELKPKKEAVPLKRKNITLEDLI